MTSTPVVHRSARRRPSAHSVSSERLAALARFTLRHKKLVLALWVATAAALALAFPQIETVVHQQSVDLIPSDVPSFQTLQRMGEAFGEQGSKTMLVVAMEDPAGLTPQTRARYGELVSRLRADTEHVALVQDLLADPLTATQITSSDGKAWYLPVGIVGALGDQQAAQSVHAVREAAATAFAGTDTMVRVTGPAATFTDQVATGEQDLTLITVVTALMVGLILLMVYRSVMTALLPLLAIGVALAVGRGVLSVLAQFGMPVSQFTIPFITAVLMGAGIDYSVFLISRFHELRRAGVESDEAVVGAVANVGRIIIASAATVVFALLAMAFGQLRAIAGVGPACAAVVAIGMLASLTLLPPLLAIAAKRGWVEPKADRTRRYWNRLGVVVVRRPVRMLALSLVILLGLSAAALSVQITFDDRAGQPATTASNEGYQLLDRHFRKDMAFAQFLVVESPVDMRTGRGLADLDALASRVSQVPGVTKLSGITRPGGQRLEQAQISWQNGQIGDKMAGAVAAGNARRSDLAQLTAGADQLADGLAQLQATLSAALGPLAGALDSVGGLRRSAPLLTELAVAAPGIDRAFQAGAGLGDLSDRADQAIGVIAPLVGGLDAAPWCAPNPQCVQLREQSNILVNLRDDGFFRSVRAISDAYRPDAPVAGTVSEIQKATAALDSAMGTVGGSADPAAQVRRLAAGVGQLASGSRMLAGAVKTLVDSNIEMLSGMSQVAAQLQDSARAGTGSDAASGFYLPGSAFSNQQFASMAKHFISPDGRVARFAVESEADPYSYEAVGLMESLTDAANSARPNTSLADATVSMAGFPAVNADLQRLYSHDIVRLSLFTLIIVGVILVLMLRALVAPLYLLGTVVLNYLAALGVGVLIFQYWLGQQIAWPVPLLAFIILVAVGADYNLLLVSRLREESSRNVRIGVLRTVASTGSVITSAGLIFAASMFGLGFASVNLMVQSGVIIGIGLLLDTFLVRTLTVPAIATLIGRASWWPARESR
jgi:RND superfamily putative drug exporter